MRSLLLGLTLCACRTVPKSTLAPELAGELENIAQLCGTTAECAAPHATLCDVMFRTSHACFEAAQGRRDCAVFQTEIEHDLFVHGTGAAIQLHVGKLCEAACEVRQNGHPWDDLAGALGTTDCGAM